MALSRTALDNELREKNLKSFISLLQEQGEEALRVGGNIIAFPTTDSEGNDAWVEITVKIPKGERIPKEDGGGFGGYDGYSMAEFYQQESSRKSAEAEKKKAAAEAKKAKKTSKKKTETSKESEPDTALKSSVGGAMVRAMIQQFQDSQGD